MSVKKRIIKKINWLWTRWNSCFIGADFYHFVCVFFATKTKCRNHLRRPPYLSFIRVSDVAPIQHFRLFVDISNLFCRHCDSSVTRFRIRDFYWRKQWYCALISFVNLMRARSANALRHLSPSIAEGLVKVPVCSIWSERKRHQLYRATQ